MSRRLLVLAVLTGAVLLATAVGAGAAPSMAGSADHPGDAAAARAAAADPGLADVLVRFFAAEPGAPRATAPVTVSLTGETVPVYELSADFVAGVPGAAAGTFAYFAVPARASDGRFATLWTVCSGTAWTVGNIASGNEEAGYARQLPAGAQLLHEPQVDAWYAAHGGLVTPLGPHAGPAVTLAAYQREVAGRYADKLPGSGYARQGEAGGYDTAARVLPRGEGGAPPESHDSGWIALLGLIGALALAGLGYAVHQRRRTTA